MRTLDVVKSERVFVQFTAHADERMSDVASAEDFLLELRRDANTYRDLVDLGVETAPGRFRAQVIEAMELAATMPVLLWFISVAAPHLERRESSDGRAAQGAARR